MILNKLQPEFFSSIDASTNSMAFACWQNRNLVNYGKIKYQGSNIQEKINDTAHKTWAFFQAFPAENIVIEQTIYINSPKTAANLAMSQGALLSAGYLAGVTQVGSVSPMVWQNYIGNKRLTVQEKLALRQATPGKSASWYKSHERVFRKGRTIKYVNDKYSLSLADDDIADAIAIGDYALDNWRKVMG